MNCFHAVCLATLLTLFVATLAQDLCPSKADIIFVVDESTSIDATEYDLQSSFLAAVIARFVVGMNNARFAAIRYASNASIRFLLDKFFNTTDILNDVMSWSQINGFTNHRDAFLLVNDVLNGTGNRPGVPDVVVFLSDGDPSRARFSGSLAATDLKNAGVLIITVSIGQEINETYMIDYASHKSLHVAIDNFEEAKDSIEILENIICTTIPEVDLPCIQCKDWDERSFGFVADSEDCTAYYTCYLRANGDVVQLNNMPCPTGTMFDEESAKLGVPCVHADETCPEANVESSTADPGSDEDKCPYTTDPSDSSQYGVMVGNTLTNIQSCGAVAFDDTDGVCRCLDVPDAVDCRCYLYLDFEGDVQDRSCMEGTVFNHNPLVTVKNDVGRFRGYKQHKNSGSHVSSHIMDGAFSTDCDGQYGQRTLTVAMWFRYDYEGVITDKTSGLISYCDANNGRAMFIEIRNGVVCAGLKTLDHDIAITCTTRTVTVGQWYYVAMVYEDPTLDLYLTTEADHPSCGTVSPGLTCDSAASTAQEGCVEPRNCGLDVGSGGHIDHFFVGLMDNVQVTLDASYSGCSQVPAG